VAKAAGGSGGPVDSFGSRLALAEAALCSHFLREVAMLNPRVQAVLVVLMAAAAVAAEPATIPDEARGMLMRNAADLSGLEFVITVVQRRLAAPADLPQQLRFLADPSFETNEECRVRIENDRLYLSKTRLGADRDTGEASYDGIKLYSGRPDRQDVESILRIDTRQGQAEDLVTTGFPSRHFHWTYFLEAGYFLPDFPAELGQRILSRVLHLEQVGEVLSWKPDGVDGRIETTLEGPDPCAQLRMTPQQIQTQVAHLRGDSRELQAKALEAEVLRAKTMPRRMHRLRLDPALGYAVTEQWEYDSSGSLLQYTSCKDYRTVPGRTVQLPTTCRVAAHAHEAYLSFVSPKPIYEYVVTLKSVTEKPFTDADFQLRYESAGGHVFDYTAEGATRKLPISYRVAGSIEDLEAASQPLASNSRRWLLVVIGVLVVALVALLLATRVRAKRAVK
jgi:hypothetical protein